MVTHLERPGADMGMSEKHAKRKASFTPGCRKAEAHANRHRAPSNEVMQYLCVRQGRRHTQKTHPPNPLHGNCCDRSHQRRRLRPVCKLLQKPPTKGDKVHVRGECRLAWASAFRHPGVKLALLLACFSDMPMSEIGRAHV